MIEQEINNNITKMDSSLLQEPNIEQTSSPTNQSTYNVPSHSSINGGNVIKKRKKCENINNNNNNNECSSKIIDSGIMETGNVLMDGNENDNGDDKNLNDWMELADENVRLRKLYDKLRCEYNDLEFRYETLISDKNSLNHLFQRQMTQLCDMKKTLNNSIDMNEYERIRQEMENMDQQVKELIAKNKQLKRELDQKEADLKNLQPMFDELNEQNELLKEQIATLGENRDITAKLLCDIDLMQTKINEYLISIKELSEENQELRLLIEQYQQQQQQPTTKPTSSTFLTSTSHQNCASLFETIPSSSFLLPNNINHFSSTNTSSSNCQQMISSATPSRQNSIKSANSNVPSMSSSSSKTTTMTTGSVAKQSDLQSPPLLRCSYSNLNLANHLMLPRSLMEVCSFKSNNGQTMETMADIKIIDLEQQISELRAEMMKLKLENDQLKTANIEIQKIQSNETNSQLINKITAINTNDQLVQTDPIPLTIEQKTIVRCDHPDHILMKNNHLNGKTVEEETCNFKPAPPITTTSTRKVQQRKILVAKVFLSKKHGPGAGVGHKNHQSAIIKSKPKQQQFLQQHKKLEQQIETTTTSNTSNTTTISLVPIAKPRKKKRSRLFCFL